MNESVKAYLVVGDGEPIDIGADVAKLYDLVVSSMDWGSGFLDEEDEETVVKLGVLCGFEVPDCGDVFYSSTLPLPDGSVRDHARFFCTLPRTHAGEHGKRSQ